MKKVNRRTGAGAIKTQRRLCWRRCWSWWATAHMASWSKPWKGRRPWSTQRARASWGRSCARCGLEIWGRLVTCTKSSGSRQTLPGGDRSLPDGQAPGPAVLLWLPGQVPRQARFPVNPDWHRQPLLQAVVWFDGRGGESRDAGRVPSKQKKNGSRGTNGVSENRGCSSWSSRAHAELLCAACVILWRMRIEKAKLSSEGDLKAPKQSELGAVQRRTGRTAGHRH